MSEVKKDEFDLVGAIMEYEDGSMDDDTCIIFFQKLIDNGMAWNLQGSYGRTAKQLIDAGLCSSKKKVL